MSALAVDTLQEEVRELARARNAVILAHNYQLPEVQDVADYVGDSLGLSRQAAATEADAIVFCGVARLAQSAAKSAKARSTWTSASARATWPRWWAAPAKA